LGRKKAGQKTEPFATSPDVTPRLQLSGEKRRVIMGRKGEYARFLPGAMRKAGKEGP